MSDHVWTGLADAIKAIRSELSAAIEPEAGVRFSTGPVELEFTVDVRTDANGKVKVSLIPWFGAEGGAARSTGAVHRLKVTLQPVEAKPSDEEDPWFASGEDFRVKESPLILDRPHVIDKPHDLDR